MELIVGNTYYIKIQTDVYEYIIINNKKGNNFKVFAVQIDERFKTIQCFYDGKLSSDASFIYTEYSNGISGTIMKNSIKNIEHETASRLIKLLFSGMRLIDAI
jgi:hypothetical protein